jgi:hypothetical protein
LKWKFTTGAEIVASPAIAADGTVYISSTDGNFYALNPDGTKRWQVHTGGDTRSSPVLDENGNLYFAADKEQYSLSPDSKVRGHFGNPCSIPTSAAATANGQIFMATAWSQTGAFTPDLKYVWGFPTGGYNLSGSANVSPLAVIYFTDGQRFFAVQPTTNAAPAAKSSWPLWRANPQHTGRVAK